ncbi:regulatory, FmdB family domain protein [Thauera sp. SWB20]|nr:regulatory, FmdB family domain protein [Thauera sp. SWB20]
MDSAAGAALLAPPLKSVAYQPEPLSWKPAADNCLA